MRKGKTYALLNDHASKKRKLDGAAYLDQKGAYEAEIARLQEQLDNASKALIDQGRKNVMAMGFKFSNPEH